MTKQVKGIELQYTIFEEDIPSKKLINRGVRSLSDSELLSIIVGGRSIKKGIETANKILKKADRNFKKLCMLSYNDLIAIEGVGHYTASIILSLFEIHKRINSSEIKKGFAIKNSVDSYSAVRRDLEYRDTEAMVIVLLNTNHCVINIEMLSEGGISGTIFDPVIALNKIILNKAKGIILAHNHPSDNIMPSDKDIQLTENFNKVCKLLGVTLLDHIIIGNNKYYSFADNNKI